MTDVVWSSGTVTYERIDYFPDCSAHFVDGYLPERADLFKLQRRYPLMKRSVFSVLLAGESHARDCAFVDIAQVLAHHEMRDLPYLPNPWLMAIAVPGRSTDLSSYPALTADFAADTSDGHRALILMSGPWPRVGTYVDRLVKEVGFRLKEQASYQNYDAFRYACEKMLNDSLNVLMAPSDSVFPSDVVFEKLDASGVHVRYSD